MIELSRTVRFCLNDGQLPGEAGVPPSSSATDGRHNTFASWPAMRGLGRFYQLTVDCRGQVHPVEGWFINIRHIDNAARDHIVPFLQRTLALTTDASAAPMGRLMVRILELLEPALKGAAEQIALELTPFYHLVIRRADMSQVIVKHEYEFSAAHRLHVSTLSDEENVRVFGKCNHPAGHGHNYRVQVAVRSPIDPRGHILPVSALDKIVDEHAIAKLDHKHLNCDIPEFANRNSSVENIAKVIYDWLADPVESLDAQLDAITVWETQKTHCTYRNETREPAAT